MQIELKDVSKFYKVYKKQNDIVFQIIIDRFKKLKNKNKNLFTESWALKNINLEIDKGDSVGIIGKNGSGKSTLLQIIAGTLNPSKGSVSTNGRITSLIELGSGFNLDFTGKDNVFLNGMILGMSRKQIEDKYDDILSFSEIGNYIDLPVKTYSTGMLMRLAFSVQTIFEPDILIIDEALAVGDVFFQSKCINRMKSLKDNGATILFVSHSISSVREICEKSLLLEKGKMIGFGKTKEITDKYYISLHSNYSNSFKQDIYQKNVNNQIYEEDITNPKNLNLSLDEEDKIIFPKFDIKGFQKNIEKNRFTKNLTEIQDIKVFDKHLNLINNNFDFNQLIKIRILLNVKKDLKDINFNIMIRNKTGIDLIHLDSFRLIKKGISFKEGNFIIKCDLKLPLQHGDYFIGIYIAEMKNGTPAKIEFLEVISSAYFFNMNPRRKSMIGGYLGLEADMNIRSC